MKNKLPSKKQELAEALVIGAVGTLPVVGGLLAEFGNRIFNPLEKRRNAWTREVESALDVLQSNFHKLPAELAENPAFVTAVVNATRTALGTHREEKIQALRKYIISVGSDSLLEEELQNALHSLIDAFSVSHFNVVYYLSKLAGEDEQLVNLESLYLAYSDAREKQIGRMNFRWVLSDLSNRMVVHLGDAEDYSEYSSGHNVLETESSHTKPIQITELGTALLKLLEA